jgi:ABC-2 type transport system ATP-binding protein
MLKVENLVKRFGDKYAVNDVSFEIGEGEVVGFLGPNGAGKTTIMNIITGYLSYTSGMCTVDCFEILENPTEAKKLIGYLPDQPPLYPDMKVKEYLNFIYDLKGCDLNREKHLMEVCEITKIVDMRDRLIKNLSKGYCQRVGIAQALIGNPKIIILDEPTVGLDPKQIIEIRNLIRSLGRDHTIILSTHILSEVQAVCDRIIIMNKGRIAADEQTDKLTELMTGSKRLSVCIDGPRATVAEALKGISGVIKVEAGRDISTASGITFKIESEGGRDVRADVFRVCAEMNTPILGMETVSASLEDVFMSITRENRGKKVKAK